VASLSQGRTAAAQCGLFTHKSVPVIFEPPCNFLHSPVTSSLLGPNTLLNTLFSDTLSLRSIQMKNVAIDC